MIGDLVNEKALADLCASINVMPYTIFRKLELSDFQATGITLIDPLGILDESLRMYWLRLTNLSFQ